MNLDEHFTRAVAVLPGVVRERLDGDFPLDWTVLEDAAIGADLGEALRDRRRLPEPVELLVRRLIRDIGIVPADLAACADRQAAAGAWIHWVTLESVGESYQLRNERTGDFHADIRPDSLAGFATLGMELAAEVHGAAERWVEAGQQHRRTDESERNQLAQCAVWMHGHLQAPPESVSGDRTTASLARTLEYAWNTQSVEARAALSGIRLSTARGACAPRRRHFAPATGYRLHACDPGEIRWLRALAERAAAGSAANSAASESESASASESASRGAGAETRARLEPVAPSGRDTAHETPAEDTLELGPAPDGSNSDAEVAEFERAIRQVPGAVRRRMGDTHGAGLAEALERFRDPRALDALRSALGQSTSGRSAPVVRMLEKLAAPVLADAGAQSRSGLRTASLRLETRRRPDGGYRGVESGTDAVGHLTTAGLVEQVRLGLAFAHSAWSGLSALQNAGKEGEWVLNEAQAPTNRLSASDREMLEAARDIGQVLAGIRQSPASARDQRPPSALEQAEMAAEALARVGPTVRTAAGWPGAAHAPNPRDPEGVARIAAVAEGLNGDIRSVANRLIAGWVAEAPPYGENQTA